ncbi:MAG: hypothetical protein QW076_00295 [Candidatus Anstonellales archaeon]
MKRKITLGEIMKNTQKPVIKTPSFEYTPEIFKDPEGIIFDPNKKRMVLEKLEEAYLNAWMSNKLIEISYQRLLHNYNDATGLVKDKLNIDLSQAQNEQKIIKAMLDVIKDWYKYL